MPAPKRNKFSSGGFVVPSWKDINPEHKPVTVGGIVRSYKRLFWEAEYYIHYEVAEKSLAQNFIKFCAVAYDKHEAAKLRKLPEWKFATIGKWTYMIQKGAKLDDERMACIEQEYRVLLAEAEKIASAEEPEEEKIPAPVISIQDRMKEQIEPVLGDIEGYLDDMLAGSADLKKFDPYSIMKSSSVEIKPAHAKLIRTQFESGLEEAREVVAWNDDDICEGYAFLKTARARKEFLAFFEKIITACDTIIGEGQAVRKPRKRKAPSREKLVEKLKFKDSEPALGIASIAPINILDATILWVYNVRSRKLGVFRGADGGTLSVKGNSIIGFDPNTSVQRTVRKPDQVIKGSNKLPRTKLEKLYSELKTTETALNGRMNEHTILLKVF